MKCTDAKETARETAELDEAAGTPVARLASERHVEDNKERGPGREDSQAAEATALDLPLALATARGWLSATAAIGVLRARSAAADDKHPTTASESPMGC